MKRIPLIAFVLAMLCVGMTPALATQTETQGTTQAETQGTAQTEVQGTAQTEVQGTAQTTTQTDAQAEVQSTTQGATQPEVQGTAQSATQGTAQSTAPAATPIDIYDVQGLLDMAKDPYGSYQLMADIDLAGMDWQPIDFYGTLEGNGHAILNANIRGVGPSRHTSYDGNMKPYDTLFSGFFGSLEGATVRNVQFLGTNVDVATDEPTFVGIICGHMDKSTIENCTVEGRAGLSTTGASFGVGGALGFGNGKIANNALDVVLVCRDLDVENKDEQFMGGAYACGYADLIDNKITIRGYDSDHGYVHDGGMAGMYIVYPEDNGYEGRILNNHVSGSITFFEDNLDRRAYCDPQIGENMSQYNIVEREGNTDDFVADERFEYDKDLLPHECVNAQWSDEVVAPTSTERGYTIRTCANCGYSYRTDWKPTAAQAQTQAQAQASQEAPAAVEADAQKGEETKPKAPGFLLPLVIVAAVLAVIAIVAVVLILRR